MNGTTACYLVQPLWVKLCPTVNKKPWWFWTVHLVSFVVHLSSRCVGLLFGDSFNGYRCHWPVLVPQWSSRFLLVRSLQLGCASLVCWCFCYLEHRVWGVHLGSPCVGLLFGDSFNGYTCHWRELVPQWSSRFLFVRLWQLCCASLPSVLVLLWFVMPCSRCRSLAVSLKNSTVNGI